MPEQKILRLILGDQLNEKHSWFKNPDRHVTYVIMEIRQETDYVKHHIQKVAVFFAAMRAFAKRLNELGHRVIYVRLDDPKNKQTIAANIAFLIKKNKFSHFEYMRGIYWALMPDLESMNYFHHDATLPDYYWTGKTQMNCLYRSIGQSLQHAYAHHIQRLMVTGNFALLAGVHPAEVDEWYLGVYIDAIQWVELPNTRAMSQFADGGLVATKPYISSAKYIHSMSDYCESCEYDWKKRHGDRACPFNSLYWDFFERHRDRLQKNPRVAMMYRVWDRMDQGERKNVLNQAAAYRKNMNHL